MIHSMLGLKLGGFSLSLTQKVARRYVMGMSRSNFVEKIIGTGLDKTDMQPSGHPHVQHLLDLCDQPQLAGIQLRESILNYLYGT